MTVPLTGVAGYFTREGAIVGEYNRVGALYGSALDEGFQSIWVQYASSDQTAVQALPAAVTTYRNTGQTYQATLVTAGTQSSILQVSDDTTVVPATMQQSIRVLVAQMIDSVDTINRPVLTQTITPWVNNYSDAKLLLGFTNNLGDQLDMVFAETDNIICTAASTAFQETLQITGPPTVPSNNPYWPGGSGTSTTVNITDPAQSGILTDGGFENWTGTGNNTPVNWTIANGAAGVTVFRGTGGVRGTYFAQLTSDGSQATQLFQILNLQINTVYAFAIQVKINTLDATGSFRLALTDGSAVVINNNAGAPLSLIKGLNGGSGLTTSYQNFMVYFSTPRILPLTTQLMVGYSAAPTSGRFISMDLAGAVAPSQLYTGGPYLAAFSGANRTAVGDNWTAAITNSLGSQSFARGMDRLFGMRAMGVYFPSSVTPTILDSLVTH